MVALSASRSTRPPAPPRPSHTAPCSTYNLVGTRVILAAERLNRDAFGVPATIIRGRMRRNSDNQA